MKGGFNIQWQGCDDMAFEKAKAYLEQYGLEDRIIVTEHSSATVAEAARAIGCEEEMIAKTMASYSALENNAAIKVVPLLLKDRVMQGFSVMSQMGVTCSVSNLGRIVMPEVLTPYISYFSAFTTAASAQITIASFEDRMSFGWASGIATHQLMRIFCRKLSERGLDPVVATNDYDAHPADAGEETSGAGM